MTSYSVRGNRLPLLLLALLSLSATPARPPAPIARQPLTLAQLPAALKPVGHLLEAWRWTDTNGENTLVAYRTISLSATQRQIRAHPQAAEGLHNSRTIIPIEDDARSAQLVVRQYVRRAGSYQEIWYLQNAVLNCPVDIRLNLLVKSTSVTDLNGDGQTETTVIYRLACSGDTSPATLKLIMHDGSKKFALRGHTIRLLNYSAAEKARIVNRPACCTGPTKNTADGTQEGRLPRRKGIRHGPARFFGVCPAAVAQVAYP